MRGRKPVPTKLKLVRGNPGKRKVNRNEPQAPSGVSAPPDYLNPTERRLWLNTTADAPWISRSDAGVLETYVIAWARSIDFKKETDKGVILTGPNGGAYQNPYLAPYNKAVEQKMKAAAELGLTATSRSRISIPKESKNEDPLEAYLES
jgi:P27 family predicted phage terminase small subunit